MKNDMANKILIIGVGSAGVIAADKMNIPNSKKLFIDSSYMILNKVKSDGDRIGLICKHRDVCSSLYCHCFNKPDFCRSVVSDYEDEIRESIKNVFIEQDEQEDHKIHR
jgi:predicted flavoprotein YhiN